MGYFIYDIVWCIENNEKFSVKIHHVGAGICLFYYSFKLSHQYMLLYLYGLLEFTNPFMHVAWILYYYEKKDELIFIISDFIFKVLFFFIRIILHSYYLYLAWKRPELNITTDDFIFGLLALLFGYCAVIEEILRWFI